MQIIPQSSPDWWFGPMEFYDFPETVGNVIIPTDEQIFQRGGSTTNQSQLGTSAYHVLDPELLMPKTS
jgi:hypothetical protein